jgi:hypothetical protein
MTAAAGIQSEYPGSSLDDADPGQLARNIAASRDDWTRARLQADAPSNSK